MTNFEKVRPPYKASAERQRLVERMLDIEIGQVLTYKEIKGIINEHAQSQRGFAIMRSAKKVLRNEHDRVFVNLRNQGLKRLNDEDIIEHAGTVVISVRRKVKVGNRELQCVSSAELPLEKRVDYHLNRAVLHAVHAMVTNDSIKNVRAIARSQSEDVNAGSNILQLFQVSVGKAS